MVASIHPSIHLHNQCKMLNWLSTSNKLVFGFSQHSSSTSISVFFFFRCTFLHFFSSSGFYARLSVKRDRRKQRQKRQVYLTALIIVYMVGNRIKSNILENCMALFGVCDCVCVWVCASALPLLALWRCCYWYFYILWYCLSNSMTNHKSNDERY